MNRRTIVILSAVATVIIIAMFFLLGRSSDAELLMATAQRGVFKISVKTTGELQAENSVQISGPDNIRQLRIYNVKISDMVSEGTLVDSGDYVATLDRSEIMNKLKDVETEIQEAESQLNRTALDTTLTLSDLRDQLINLKYALEERQIALEQSEYESPSVKRQAAIELEKSQRAYKQAESNYVLKVEKAKSEVLSVQLKLQQAARRRDQIVEAMDQFKVVAPQSGMVIYAREWNGAKRKVGSNVSAWDMSVATLPDLSSLVSKTFVNEIDISKVAVEQQVVVTVDAFPDKEFKGEVVGVANIGEELEGRDIKVFEVMVKLLENDSLLRPAMTTGNEIIISEFNDVVYIPIEAIFKEDSSWFVYEKTRLGFEKQMVVPGPRNENHIIVQSGLEAEQQIALQKPDEFQQSENKSEKSNNP